MVYQYKEVINSCCERFEIVTQVLLDYRQFRDYPDEESSPDTLSMLHGGTTSTASREFKSGRCRECGEDHHISHIAQSECGVEFGRSCWENVIIQKSYHKMVRN